MQIPFKLEHIFARPFREDFQPTASEFFLRIACCWVFGDPVL